MKGLSLPRGNRSDYTAGMDENQKPRWYHLTPGRCLIGLLAGEVALWLANWLVWFHKGYAVLLALAAVAAFLLLLLLWFAAALMFRVRFQFTICFLLVLAVAVAIPSAWLSWEMTKAREQKAAVEAIGSVGEGVQYDWEGLPNAQPPEPAWLRNLLGVGFFHSVVVLNLGGTKVSGAGLATSKD